MKARCSETRAPQGSEVKPKQVEVAQIPAVISVSDEACLVCVLAFAA